MSGNRLARISTTVSFAALLVWIFGLFWSTVALDGAARTGLALIDVRALWQFSQAAGLAAFGILVREPLRRLRTLAAVGSSCAVLGTALFSFGPIQGFPAELSSAGVVLGGVGSSFLLALSAVALAAEGRRGLLASCAVALALAACADLALLLLPQLAQALVLSLLPIVYLCAFIPGALSEGGLPATLTCSFARTERAGGLAILLLPLVVGLSYGVMQRLTEGIGTAPVESSNAGTILTFLLSAAVIGASAQAVERAGSVRLVLFIALPLVGIAFLSLPFNGGLALASKGLCIVGFNSFYFMIWSIWAAHGSEPVRIRSIVLGLGALVVGEGAGIVASSGFAPLLASQAGSLALLALGVSYAMIMAGFLLMRSDGRGDLGKPAEGAADSAAPTGELLQGTSGPAPDRDAPAIAALVREGGLSQREAEVLSLLLKGMGRQAISRELVVSENTTRTHMRNIYRKLGVHSQQELMGRARTLDS